MSSRAVVSAPKGIRTRYWLLFACCFSLDAIRAPHRRRPSPPFAVIASAAGTLLFRRGCARATTGGTRNCTKTQPAAVAYRLGCCVGQSIIQKTPWRCLFRGPKTTLRTCYHSAVLRLSSYQTKCTPYTKGGRVYRDIRKANFTTGTLVAFQLHTRNCFPDSHE